MAQGIESYSRVHRHFLADDLPLPLLFETVAAGHGGVVADLGAGDGAVLWALKHRGLFPEKAYAVDLSPDRVAAAQDVSSNVIGIVADATDVQELEDGSVDGVIVSQVIEHIPDDRALAPEIARLLRPGGWWYVGTVLRARRAWWFYTVDGVRRLDPTHVREYESPDELLHVLAHPKLRVDDVRTAPFSFAATDLALRAAALARVIPYAKLSSMYQEKAWLARTRRLRVRPPGFSLIEVAGRKPS
jgi:SAM-dependent methyltransferase